MRNENDAESQPRKKHVVIFGGGITGLTVAQECVEAGVQVTVFESFDRFGGKALSLRLPEGQAFEGAPVEHSLRGFQSTYWSLFETMKRIPHPKGGSTFSQLRPIQALAIQPAAVYKQAGIPERMLPTTTRRSPLLKLCDLYRSIREWGVSRREFIGFLGMVVHYLSTEEEQRRTRIGRRTFAQHARFQERSTAFREYFQSLAEIAVSAKPEASADVLLDLYSKFITASWLNIHGAQSFINVTDGPIHEALIEPWIQHLRYSGARLEHSVGVEGLSLSQAGGITGARLSNGEEIRADAYVLAIPHAAIRRVAPSLEQSTGLASLRDEWSNGFQFFLSEVPDEYRTQQALKMVFGSPWRLVYLVEGPPLWSEDVPLAPGVRAVLSVTMSQQGVPGIVFGKPFEQCTWEEVQDELLAQIGWVDRSQVMGAHPDPTLSFVKDSDYQKLKHSKFLNWAAGPVTETGHRWVTKHTLCIATPESRQAAFPIATAIDGLFMAGEFTETPSKTPNMEKANQAGKLCAAGVLSSLSVSYPRQRLLAPSLPTRLFRILDFLLRRMGLNYTS